MTVDLKSFQKDAIVSLLRQLRSARSDVTSDIGKQAIIFSAPTGAGKTVVMASFIEQALFGGEQAAVAAVEPDAELCFLWLSDSPSLNEQSRRRIRFVSPILGPDRLVIVDNTFVLPRFEPGHTYFLNHQKLRHDTLLNRLGNDRSYTIWETIAATEKARPGKLIIIVDEAHRGLERSRRDENDVETIAGAFIAGGGDTFTIRSPDNGRPVPFPSAGILIGVSATPARIDRFLERDAGRVRRVVRVDPGSVRGHGLIKDRLELFGVEDPQHPWTLLRAAAERFLSVEQRWAEYCDKNPDAGRVLPALIVQVQDGTNGSVSDTPIAQAISTLREALPDLTANQIAHCFSGADDIVLDADWTIRSVSPNEIQELRHIRVVLFKTALNTGWDCPRAEVLMSFRRVEDGTNIAQLVGRMVRTPLARSIPSDETLNAAYLYLPHYDRAELLRIKDYLTAPDVDSGIEVGMGDEILELEIRPDGEHLRRALDLLPTQVVTGSSSIPHVRRTYRMARLLVQDGVAPDAVEALNRKLVDLLVEEMERKYAGDLLLRENLRDRQSVPLVSLVLRDGEIEDGETRIAVQPSDIDIENAFRAAASIFSPELGSAYYRERLVEDEPHVARAEFLLLTKDAALRGRAAEVAASTFANLSAAHRAAILALPEGRRSHYIELQRSGRGVQDAWLAPEGRIRVAKDVGAQQQSGHLFVRPGTADECPIVLNGWERAVLDEERQRHDFRGFLRNLPRKSWALSIAYDLMGWQAMYPDFLIFRERPGNRVVVDILEPHSGEDSVAKLKGMAAFAERHGHAFGRIEMIRSVGGGLKRLGVHDPAVRRMVSDIASHEQLLQAFANA
jgi:type III restriction enzyme